MKKNYEEDQKRENSRDNSKKQEESGTKGGTTTTMTSYGKKMIVTRILPKGGNRENDRRRFETKTHESRERDRGRAATEDSRG
jgi:hypothetical protein